MEKKLNDIVEQIYVPTDILLRVIICRSWVTSLLKE